PREEVREVEPPHLPPELELVVDRRVVREHDGLAPEPPPVPVPPEAGLEPAGVVPHHPRRHEVVVDPRRRAGDEPEARGRPCGEGVGGLGRARLVLLDPRLEEQPAEPAAGVGVARRAEAARVLPRRRRRLPAPRRLADGAEGEDGQRLRLQPVVLPLDRERRRAVAVEPRDRGGDAAEEAADGLAAVLREQPAVERRERLGRGRGAGGEGVEEGVGLVGRERLGAEGGTGEAAEHLLPLEEVVEVVFDLEEPLRLRAGRGGREGGEEQGEGGEETTHARRGTRRTREATTGKRAAEGGSSCRRLRGVRSPRPPHTPPVPMPDAALPAVYPPPADVQRRAFVASMEDYERSYRHSVDDPEGFWREQAERLDWFAPFGRVKDVSYDPHDVHIRWYLGGKLNACHNALDRHVEAGKGARTAFLFEPDEPGEAARRITYAEALGEVKRMAAVLRAHGVRRGDRVTIYLPMIPEAAYAMLACARLGAIHSVIFAGFS